jgi:hypothetical protein
MRPSLWPTTEQLLLLRAALSDGDEALEAFAEWRRRVDYEHVLDGGSFRMLPLAHANMIRLGCTDPVLTRLGGVYRHSWCTVQHRTRLAAETVSLLKAQGIPVLIAKGLPIALDYYASPGLRPMSDIDLVVPREQALAALALLEAQGWRMADSEITRRVRERPEDMLAMQCALPLTGPGGAEIDLHWRMIAECARAEAEQRFWRDAEPLAVEGAEALRPSPTHLLFHVIVHGLKPDPLPAIRWVADATMILRRDAARIDWREMATLARDARVRRRLGQGIAYLRDTMRIPLPEAALPLIAARPCWVERIEQRAFNVRMARNPVGKLRLETATSLARMAVGSRRGYMPGLAARWLGRRLQRLVQPA